MKDRTKAYMAGMMDGDGNFTIRHHLDTDGYRNYVAQIILYNTDRRIMKWAVQHFGGIYRFNREATEQSKACYMWTPQGAKHSLWFLDQVLPYLQIKKEEAGLIKSYLELNGQKNPERREALRIRCSELKQRDSVTTDSPSFSNKKNLVNAYFAGLFDAEGDASIKRTQMSWGFHYATAVDVTNSYIPILNAMPPVYGGSVEKLRKRKPYHMGTIAWSIHSQPAQETFLLQMLPYLIIKREKANVLLQFTRLRGKHDPVSREKLYLLAEKIQSELHGDMQSDSPETPNP